ncbi:hypothetical protein O0544_22755 [Edwardsiella anguillarum]|nr:hypothetical protein [Edwardsiella anguillarum]
MKRLAIAGLIAGAAFMADGHPAQTADFELMQAIPQNTEAVFQQSDIHATATVWLRMIRQARHSLDIGTFYMANQSGEARSLSLMPSRMPPGAASRSGY